MNNFNYKKLTPFKLFVLENFPFIEADFDALTEWQLFCKLDKEINKIIDSENTVGTQMENVTNAFIELQNYVNNYFNNLDVQDEINNKLNEMVENGTFITILANYLPFITFEMYGAIGDGTTDDTTAISTALNTGYKIVGVQGKTYLISQNISVNKDIHLDLTNAKIKSSLGNNIVITSGAKNINISNGELDNVCIIDEIDTETNYSLNNLYVHNTNIYGLKLDYLDTFYAEKCNFNEIGTGDININNQGIAIRINSANYVNINNSVFTKSHGTGANVIRNTKEMYITNNYYNNNDYRAIVPADDNALFVCKGLIANNHIENCGVNASHHTGVGCNGIYSNSIGNIKDLVVSGNYIKNVCENGIEGRFGVVEYNIVDGTGVDQINHPTPSASGINMYGGIYRYNVVKNSYLAGLYVSGESHSQDTSVSNKKIYGNNIGKCLNTPSVAIFINGTAYNNIECYDNICDGSITIASAAKFNNCIIGNNYNKQGKTYTNASSGINLIDKGAIRYGGFTKTEDSVSNVTTAGVNITLESNGDVTFTSTRDNGSFSITADWSKYTIASLLAIVNDNNENVKITATGIKDDDSTTTIAYQRNIDIIDGLCGIFAENQNDYKQIKFTIIVGNTNETLTLKNLQIKEINY